MQKTVKKLDNNVVKGLTIACENIKCDVEGFEWLTHRANYANFPGSLLITCVFDNNQSLQTMLTNKQDVEIKKQIHKQLLKVGVLLKRNRQHVCFDSEEACLLEHDGDWKRRLIH